MPDDPEKEDAAAKRADEAERKRGGTPAGASDQPDGHAEAEAVERASGGIRE